MSDRIVEWWKQAFCGFATFGHSPLLKFDKNDNPYIVCLNCKKYLVGVDK
jgi:hypothetical protein